MRPDFNTYFMLLAKIASLRSGCNSRPTGAVIVKDKRVISTGYNGSIPGVDQCVDHGETYCHRRESGAPDIDKYNTCPSIHAEANAINQAAKFGVSVDEAVMYCTLAPCYICLKNIKSVGIWKVYYELKYESDDKERDGLWSNFARIGLDCEQISIPSNVAAHVYGQLLSETSYRRL